MRVTHRVFAIHKERHRESGLRVDLQFNQSIMRFDDDGTWKEPHLFLDTPTPARPSVDPDNDTSDRLSLREFA